MIIMLQNWSICEQQYLTLASWKNVGLQNVFLLKMEFTYSRGIRWCPIFSRYFGYPLLPPHRVFGKFKHADFRLPLWCSICISFGRIIVCAATGTQHLTGIMKITERNTKKSIAARAPKARMGSLPQCINIYSELVLQFSRHFFLMFML